MKIALITLEGGGISTVCYGLAYQLSRKKIPVTIYTETSGKRELKSVSDSLKIAYLHRVELPPRSIWFQLQNFQFLLGNLSNFDIIHGVSPDASTLVTFYKRKLKKPYVVSFHAEPLTVARQFLKAPLSSWAPQDFAHQIVEYPLLSYNIRRCAKQADHIIVCSFAALKEFQNANRNLDLERVSVIYNAVDLDEIDGLDISDTYESKSENLSILFAGRLFWVKGLAYLLKAFEIVQEDLKEVRLEIFGEGPEENRFKKSVSKAGLDEQVHFHGRIPNKALISEMRKADLIVSPGIQEAQSMFVLEGMACKKPVVTFDIPSMREIIKDGKNGLLAKSFDPNDLSERIRLVLSDRKLRTKLGQNAYNYVKEKHNWNKQIEKYLEIYAGLT